MSEIQAEEEGAEPNMLKTFLNYRPEGKDTIQFFYGLARVVDPETTIYFDSDLLAVVYTNFCGVVIVDLFDGTYPERGFWQIHIAVDPFAESLEAVKGGIEYYLYPYPSSDTDLKPPRELINIFIKGVLFPVIGSQLTLARDRHLMCIGINDLNHLTRTTGEDK